ncbi:MAG: IS481 family transposase [Rhodobacteraceae bacterium]|nr:IS481 family transposase [Paracoccaceae bacterium]
MGPKPSVPSESLLALWRRLASLPARSPERRTEVTRVATMFGVSIDTIYRALRRQARPRGLRRTDRGRPRVAVEETLRQYCEIIAPLKVCTRNRKGRHLSTVRAIRLLEEYGVDTEDGHVQAPPGLLRPTTVNRWLAAWEMDHDRLIRGPAAVRFEARHSNVCWHFDMSPSDLKHVDQPAWIDPDRGPPTLTLFSVVDDRSGVSYQEYHSVYGEDAEDVLRFLFNAMTTKEDNPLQGIPAMLDMDNGPVSRSLVFQTMMDRLGVDWRTHMPAGSDGNRVTARAKGKVERPFRTVKEAHETLYHLHKPATEAEANAGLAQFMVYDNSQSHRREPHSRAEDWLANLPPEGVREMCSWERYCAFAREPETRKVGSDARIQVAGSHYEIHADLAGETVTLWWGHFDQDLFVEWRDQRFGPYRPQGGPIPLHRYRKPRASRRSRRAIADQMCRPLGDLDPDGLAFIDALLERTLDKKDIKDAVHDRFRKGEVSC